MQLRRERGVFVRSSPWILLAGSCFLKSSQRGLGPVTLSDVRVTLSVRLSLASSLFVLAGNWSTTTTTTTTSSAINDNLHRHEGRHCHQFYGQANDAQITRSNE